MKVQRRHTEGGGRENCTGVRDRAGRVDGGKRGCAAARQTGGGVDKREMEGDGTRRSSRRETEGRKDEEREREIEREKRMDERTERARR